MDEAQGHGWTHWDPLWRREWEALLNRAPHQGERWLAAFDADGTLWADDAGEAMLRHLAHEGAFPGRGAEDVLGEYAERVDQDVSDGYAWAVTVMEGLSEELVERAARTTMEGFLPGRLFAPMASLLANLHANPRWEVAIVSASNRWIVEAGAVAMGVSPSNVVGIQVPVVEGVLTGQAETPLVNGEGKVHALRKRFGRDPALAMGNTMNDAPMLAIATELAVVVNPDRALHERALANGWAMCTQAGEAGEHA